MRVRGVLRPPWKRKYSNACCSTRVATTTLSQTLRTPAEYWGTWGPNRDGWTNGIVQQHPKAFGIWSEIVMQKESHDVAAPGSDQSSPVQAILYSNAMTMYRASDEAEKFGGIPVLNMEAARTREWFECTPPYRSRQWRLLPSCRWIRR
jgi:hypothetical protein